MTRFNLSERLFHWALALPFLALLVTGILLALPDTETLLAHRTLLHDIHLWSAVAVVLGPVLVLLLGDRRSLLHDVREIDLWDRLDWRWLRLSLVPGPLRRDPLPPAGRFNAGQKLNSALVGVAVTVLVLTGAAMWRAEAFPVWVSEVATQFHDLGTILVLPLVVGHLFLALINPGTRPSLPGMLTGRVDPGWLAEHHGRERP